MKSIKFSPYFYHNEERNTTLGGIANNQMSQHGPLVSPDDFIYSSKEATLDVSVRLPNTADELSRLAILEEYGLLEMQPDAGLESLIRLAAHVCQAPIALITVAGQQDRVQACVGMNANALAGVPEFCRQVARQSELFFSDSVTGFESSSQKDQPDVRFGVGLPLISPDDHLLGSLCLLDTHPFTLAEDQQQAFLTVARAIQDQWELRRSLSQSLRAEQASRMREQQSAAIVHGTLDSIIMLDHLGRIREWNPAAEQTFGYARREALGQVMVEMIIPPRLRERHHQGVARFLETGEGPVINQRVELPALRADGKEIIIELAITVNQPDAQKPPFFIGYARDISAQKRNKAALEQARDDLEMRVRERTTELAQANAALRAEIRQRTDAEAKVRLLNDHLVLANQELTRAYDTTIEGWARALDMRDKETEGHSRRVTEMSMRLADCLGLSNDEKNQMRRGALLHDIGKMGIPDHILHKPGPLDASEWEIMRRHPEYARDMLRPIAFLESSLTVPYCHHEKWDGTGYPQGLKGEEIALAARIFSVVDVWDALRSDRPYRPAWTNDEVRRHMASLSGTHFDPTVVNAFLSLLPPGAEEA